MKKKIIYEIEKEQMKKKLPPIKIGDTVLVKNWVSEGNKKRLQIFDGIIISIRKLGLNSSFTVRKNIYNIGIERLFKIHSPVIESIIIKKNGIVRKAKLYYLRLRIGKAARIKNK